MMNSKRGLAALIIVLIVLAIIIVGGVVYVAGQRNSVPKKSEPNQSIVANPTANPNPIAPQQSLTADDLKNGTYIYANGLDYLSGEIQKFEVGRTATVIDKGTSSWSTLDIDHLAIGDLNGDSKPDAAIIVTNMLDASANGGTGGSDMILNAVVNEQGSLHVVADTYLGSAKYVTVAYLTIQSGIISVKLNDSGTDKTLKYKLSGNTLVAVH